MHPWHEPGVAWRSGRWSLERRDDELADISFDGRVVVRSIRAVVRDRDWNTADWVPAVPEEGERMLRIGLRSEGLGSDVRGDLIVEASGDELRVTLDAVSHEEFWTNRTGLVVLQPPHLAGSTLRVTHPDGSTTDAELPRAISPHQPVLDIAALRWSSHEGEVDLGFTGEVFEMEDQRNWTDASFKVYSRPLSLPFPYRLAAGERVTQSVSLRVSAAPRGADDEGTASLLELTEGGPFPRVGVTASTAPDPEPSGLPRLGSELLVELDLATPNWRAALNRAVGRGLPLDVRVVSPDHASLTALAEALRGAPLARIAVFDPSLHVSTAPFVDALRSALRSAGLTVPVIGGSRSHFTELNREGSRIPDHLDGLAVTVTPLFHSLSTAQLEESVAVQRLVAEQTVGDSRGLPVHVGPIALRPRFNNVATAEQPGPTRTDLAEGYGAEFTGAIDDRQGSPELAAWVVASAAALAVPGVATLTWFEEWGPRGVYDTGGRPFPAAEALHALAGIAGGRLLHGASPDGLVWAVGSRRPSGATVLAANLDRVARTFEVATPAASAPLQVTLEPRRWARYEL